MDLKSTTLNVAKLFLLILLFSTNTYGQKLLKSRQTSYYTYIFKISDHEAKKVYKKGLRIIDESYFHTLVDSFCTDSIYSGTLDIGHYLRAHSDKDKLSLEITTVQNYGVYVVNNNTDLSVQIIDNKGVIIQDADVSVHGKKLHYNKKEQCYLDHKSNRKGFLKVTYDGFTTYYDLERKQNNSFVKRNFNMLVYRTPLKLVWLPVRYVVRLPYDGVKSIVNGYPYRSIYRTLWFFKHIPNKFRKIVYPYHPAATGYMVFNKPKYMPGDTVKFKAYIIPKRKGMVKKDLTAILEVNSNKRITLGDVPPYNFGGYMYQFILHDSLNILLDKNYSVILKNKKGSHLISGSFRYEDYELLKPNLDTQIPTNDHYRDNNLAIYMKATDENDLILQDARARIIITPQTLNSQFVRTVFLPDTILNKEIKLKPFNETEYLIPDSLFPKANFDYNLKVTLMTSDNKTLVKNETIHFYEKIEKFKMALDNDSIEFKYTVNGFPDVSNATVYGYDFFGNKNILYDGKIPYKMKVNPTLYTYILQNNNHKEYLNLKNESPSIYCYSERTKKNLKIMVSNPRRIPFSYYVYKKNREIASGYGDELNFDKNIHSKKNVIISLRYLWGGEIRKDDYSITLDENRITLSVNQPKIVYPGQKTTIEIQAVDSKGNPAKKVDLTAYSITKKFDYTPPVLPRTSSKQKSKTIINNFDLSRESQSPYSGKTINYEMWKAFAGLDSIEYYRFIYPGNSIYRFEYSVDNQITQFAPFVVSKGTIQPIHVIYVDSKPVYFSWTKHNQPYSFTVKPGKHHIELRTTTKTITLNNFYFRNGKKTIFSIDMDKSIKGVSVETVPTNLTDDETTSLYRYILPYFCHYNNRSAYIESGEQMFYLEPTGSYYNRRYGNYCLAGPVSGTFSYRTLKGYSHNYTNNNNGFAYIFEQDGVTLYDIGYSVYPESLHPYGANTSLNDQVLTKKAFLKQLQDRLNPVKTNKARYNNLHYTRYGSGKMILNISSVTIDDNLRPANILVLRYDDSNYLRIYPGNMISTIHDLKEGLYQVVLYYPDGKYYIEDEIMVRPNGTTYHHIEEINKNVKDEYSDHLTTIINETIYKDYTNSVEVDKQLNKMYQIYQNNSTNQNNGPLVEGIVTDAKTGEPLIGVTVYFPKTKRGTITNIDGYYKITIPDGHNELQFSFLGYESKTQSVNSGDVLNISLDATENCLESVVVVGYGSVKRRDLTGCVATTAVQTIHTSPFKGVSTTSIDEALKGRLAGVEIASHSGAPGGGVTIRVRGGATMNFDKDPLFVINGKIFNGDISEIDQNLIISVKELKDQKDLAIYGSRGLNGVVLIETRGGTYRGPVSKGADYDETFLEAASQASSIRENFSDYAFWKPDLRTDKDGKARFNVTFPDDITNWRTFFLAMNHKKQSGQTSGEIKSYKPVMAQLSTPRFLVESDSSWAIGKSLNYSPDTLKIKRKYLLNDTLQFTRNGILEDAIIDSLHVVAINDTVTLQYHLETEAGYFDGEKRKIPVYPIGLEATEGSFLTLNGDTTVQIDFNKELGDVSLYVRADILEVLLDEIDHVIHYKYLCNEQLASKLKVLLAKRRIAVQLGEKFKDDKKIITIIQLLMKNKKKNDLWGWWKTTPVNYWISCHVTEALIQAQEAGFNVSLNTRPIIDLLVWNFDNVNNFRTRLKYVEMLNLLKAPVDYQAYIDTLDHMNHKGLNNLLHLTELKQKLGMPYEPDSLKTYQKGTLFGNIYYSEYDRYSIWDNNIQNTLIAYRILRADTTDHSAQLQKIRNYLLERRKNCYWRNTYESTKIIETILPDVMGKDQKLNKPTIQLKGEINKTVTEFPYEAKLHPDQSLEINKKGDYPVYLTAYQRYWDANPAPKKNDFEVNTYFSNDSAMYLTGGKQTTLIAEINVKKNAEYVMINIPIPAGCSYASKRNSYYYYGSHWEYFKNEVDIFCENLSKGKHYFRIDLIPRFTGSYVINPTKIELMYFPTFNANNEIKRVKIK